MPLTVRVPPVELSRLDAYIAAQPDPKPSRPEAIRALLREGLRKPPIGEDTIALLSAMAARGTPVDFARVDKIVDAYLVRFTGWEVSNKRQELTAAFGDAVPDGEAGRLIKDRLANFAPLTPDK